DAFGVGGGLESIAELETGFDESAEDLGAFGSLRIFLEVIFEIADESGAVVSGGFDGLLEFVGGGELFGCGLGGGGFFGYVCGLNLTRWVGRGNFIRLPHEDGTIYRIPTAEKLRVQLGSIEERSLRHVARRAKSARKKNPGDSGRDDRKRRDRAGERLCQAFP